MQVQPVTIRSSTASSTLQQHMGSCQCLLLVEVPALGDKPGLGTGHLAGHLQTHLPAGPQNTRQELDRWAAPHPAGQQAAAWPGAVLVATSIVSMPTVNSSSFSSWASFSLQRHSRRPNDMVRTWCEEVTCTAAATTTRSHRVQVSLKSQQNGAISCMP